MSEPTPEELDEALKDSLRRMKELEARYDADLASKEAERKLLERVKDQQEDK